MTDTVNSECMTKKLILLIKLHDQAWFLAPLKRTLSYVQLMIAAFNQLLGMKIV